MFLIIHLKQGHFSLHDPLEFFTILNALKDTKWTLCKIVEPDQFIWRPILSAYISIITDISISAYILSDMKTCHVTSLSIAEVLLLEPIPALFQGDGRVLPGQVASSSQGPHWWAMWGSVSRSRTLQHAAQPCPEAFSFRTYEHIPPSTRHCTMNV